MSPSLRVGYRLVKRKWSESAFDGEGAKRYGGRWNSRGRRCVYLASSESLAILEVMVHLDDYRQLESYALFQLEWHESQMMALDASALPSNWRVDPAPPETAAIGDEWLASGASLALSVPSVIVPREQNYLLNCEHPAFSHTIEQAKRLEFSPDSRLVSGT